MGWDARAHRDFAAFGSKVYTHSIGSSSTCVPCSCFYAIVVEQRLSQAKSGREHTGVVLYCFVCCRMLLQANAMC